jgi:riboflavin biosynthesis pyrimidine reductase
LRLEGYLPGVKQLFPTPIDQIDPGEVYRADRRRPVGDRPWLALDMVTSIDGAVTVAGRSGGLSSPGDKAVFFALRAIADVVLVGAGTARAENYGPPRVSPIDQEHRRSRGQDAFPRIAVVSGRLGLDPDARLFRDSPSRPIVLTLANADVSRREALEAVAEVIVAGETAFDPAEALRALGERGSQVVIGEGGPTLNGSLLSAGVVDEVCFSLAPLLTSGDSARLAHGLPLDPPTELSLERVIEDNGYLFLRYLRRPDHG